MKNKNKRPFKTREVFYEEESLDRLIEMAWQDRTTFEWIN